MFITYGYNIYDNNGTHKGGGNGANVLQFTEIKSRLARINCDNLNLHIEEGNGNPLQYSCLENPMDGGAWQAAVHGVAKSQTRLNDFTFHFHALEKERLHFSLSCIGEGNGNPLQCSCLKNPRDGGTWWAAIYGAAQSRT